MVCTRHKCAHNMLCQVRFISNKALILILVICTFGLIERNGLIEACSSRAISKPRASTSESVPVAILSSYSSTVPPTTTTTTTTTTTPRPNITFPTYKCPATYDAWYCLNDATCFSVKIGDSIMYNCECAIGFMGPRCEYKELDGSYLPKRPRPILEKASIASGALCALLFLLFICLVLYLHLESRTKILEVDFVTDSCDFCKVNCPCCHKKYCMLANDKRILVSDGTKKQQQSSYTMLLRQRLYDAIPLSLIIKRSSKL